MNGSPTLGDPEAVCVATKIPASAAQTPEKA